MKALIALSLACLVAAVAWALWPSAATEGAAEKPRSQHAPDGSPRTFGDLPDLAEREEPGVGELAETGEDEVDLVDSEDLVSVRGRVVVASGAEPESIRVLLQSLERECIPQDTDSSGCGPANFSTVTDPETGDFDLEVPPGTYTIVARADGLLPAGERGLKLNHGESVEGLMLTLGTGEHISGMVYNEGAAETGVRVVATGEGFVRSAFTDDTGRFDIAGLPHGEFTVRAYATFTGGDEKKVRSGGSVNLELGHREHVHGRVLDAHGFPAQGVTVASDFVSVHATENSDPWPDENMYGEGGMDAHGCGPAPECYTRMVTDADGRFELETSPGEELIVAASRGNERALVEGVSFEKNEEVVLQLEPPREARLLDADGKPLKSTIWVGNAPVFWTAELTSDENGTVLIPAHAGLLFNIPTGSSLTGDLPDDVGVQELEYGGNELTDRPQQAGYDKDLELNPPPPQVDSSIIY